jgi:hypothetical protein
LDKAGVSVVRRSALLTELFQRVSIDLQSPYRPRPLRFAFVMRTLRIVPLELVAEVVNLVTGWQDNDG